MRIIRTHLGEDAYLETRGDQALAAALVHDLGHGPFSHAFEDLGKRLNLKIADHEKVGDTLIREGEVAEALKVLGSGFPNDVAEIIKAGGPKSIYSAVVSSQFDADRLDYMQRDRLMTGSEHAAIDFEWLLSNVQVGDVPLGVDEEQLGSIPTFVLGPKAIYAAEAYVLGLFQLYPTVYFHKATRGAEKMFTELMIRVVALAQDGSLENTGLKKSHPLARFARKPSSVRRVVALDDTTVTGTLPLMAEAKDPVIQDLATRLRDRKLYKSINVREQIKKRLGLDESAEGAGSVDRACASIEAKVEEWVAEKGPDHACILSDKDVREPYKDLQESKGPLNQIMIRTEDGELVDLGKRSKVVKAIDPFRLYRLYVRDENVESRKFVRGLIEGEGSHAANA